jgi:tripartite-type tricarboxylate transporter receptor subunit TctC
VERLDQAIKKAVEDPEFIKLIDRLRMRVAYLDHEEFAEHVKKAYKEQGEIIKKAGLAKEE